jgi:hypothetical protein
MHNINLKKWKHRNIENYNMVYLILVVVDDWKQEKNKKSREIASVFVQAVSRSH